MNPKTLSNPPIIEALIELRFLPSDQITLEQLDEFSQAVSEKYPKKQPIYAQSVEVAFRGEDHTTRANAIPSGYRLTDIDGNRIVVCAIDRLVVSFLRRYISWPSLLDATKENYAIYKSYVSQGKKIRVGMRFINRIKIPLKGITELEKYVKTLPNLPQSKGIPESLKHFETLVTIPLYDITPCGTATVRQVLLPPETDDGLSKYRPFILDIDVYCELQGTVDDSSFWELIEKFRDKKNRLFFASLTDKALEPYR